jgi:hypothetical protein
MLMISYTQCYNNNNNSGLIERHFREFNSADTIYSGVTVRTGSKVEFFMYRI